MKPAPLALCANILHSQLKYFVCQTKACELDSKGGPKLEKESGLIWAGVGLGTDRSWALIGPVFGSNLEHSR